MRYCTYCGKEVMDEAVVCTNCGCPVNGASNIQNTTNRDIPNGGLNVLAFLIPLVGLIMYCVMHGKTPRKANQIGAFALVGWILGMLLVLTLFPGVFDMLGL